MQESIELKTLKGRFTEALFKVAEELVSDDRKKFRYMLQGMIPAQIIERDEPLEWFTCLEKQDIISEDDISYLVDLLKQAKLFKLVNDIHAVFIIRQKLLQRMIGEIEFRSRGCFVVKMPERHMCDGQSPVLLSKGLKKSLRVFKTSASQQADSKKFNMIIKDSANLFVKHCNQLKHYDDKGMAFKLLFLVEQLYESVGDCLLEIYPKFPHFMNVPTVRKNRKRNSNDYRKKRSVMTKSDHALAEYNRRSPSGFALDLNAEKGSRCRQLCYKGKTKGMYRRFLVMERLLARQVLERFSYAESETKGRCSDSQCKSKAEDNTILLSNVESLKRDVAKQSNMLAFFGGVLAVLVTIIILKI